MKTGKKVVAKNTDRSEQVRGGPAASGDGRDPSLEERLARALGHTPLNPRASYTGQIVDLLRHAIVRGWLPPGTPLSEAAIAAAVGVSRTPVREAVGILADENLVNIYPQVKTVVAPVRKSFIDEGRFVRGTLECANHVELASRITAAQIAELKTLVRAQRSAAGGGHVEQFFLLDEAMHRRIFEMAGREHVWTMLEPVKRHFDRVRWLLLERVAYHAKRAHREHELIIDRLAAGDVAGLTKAVHQHIDAISKHLAELRDRAPESYFVD